MNDDKDNGDQKNDDINRQSVRSQGVKQDLAWVRNDPNPQTLHSQPSTLNPNPGLLKSEIIINEHRIMHYKYG